jgi:hypothetical protein
MAVERKHRVLASHSVSVIAHLDQRLATLFQVDPDPGGGRVDGVLDQLLHGGGRAFDHFAGRDLVGNGIGQDGDAAGHAER